MGDTPQPPDTEELAQRLARLATTPPRPPAALPSTGVPQVDSDLPAAVGAHRTRMLHEEWERCVPLRFRAARVEHVDEPVRTELVAWCAEQTGNLVLLGPVGVGKTHAAVGVMRELMRSGRHPRFYPVAELLDLLRPGGPEGAAEQLAACDVLVVDDLGSERPTEWTAERLYALVNRRWMEERPIVATTNYEPDVLPEVLGERTHSRLVGDAAVLRLTGPDRRLA